MSLSKYIKKREFSATPEPKGNEGATKDSQLRFVVQKHDASHLHYDLRLELDGVLKSWAVPKGPSLNPHDHHLAIAVEDHPLEYINFKGKIPKGNYGAGTVVIYDKGTYQPRVPSKDPQKEIRSGLRQGHLTFILSGKKLKGEFALIRNERIGKNSWLLIKKGDQFAHPKGPVQVDLNAGINFLDNSKKTAKLSLPKTPKSTMPTNIKPMLATLVEEPFDDSDWAFEIKWDGYRALASKQKARVSLRSRNNIDFGDRFDLIASEMEKFDNDVVVDGEIVAIDAKGHPHFEWLQNYKTNPHGDLVYYVFDILWVDGKNVQPLSLVERRKILKSLLPMSDHIRFSDDIDSKGKAFFAKAERQNLEGIMAKKKTSTYQQGARGKEWLKIKTHMRQEVVIGGFTEPKGSREAIGPLIMGTYENDKLVYRGHVGGGIPPAEIADLRNKLERIARVKSPFAEEFKSNDVVHWVKPSLVCEVKFAEWTSEGRMRQPIFVGLRPDKPAKDVVREEVKAMQAKTPKSDQYQAEVEITHRDKVFWPEMGYTKGDLLDYYKSVAQYILPYLEDRPQSLLRQPDGYKGSKFFQKDLSGIAPKWTKTIDIYSESAAKTIHYLICNDVKTLEYMVQLGCIEINPWNSRVKTIKHPDWVVIDLDPEGVSFETVIEVAQAVGDICKQYKIDAYPKTSGKTGIHILIPLGAKYTYNQAKDFAFLLVNLVHKKVPKITSLERMPAKRPHKVYLDYLQNRGGQTLACVYCVRPTKSASVSTPLHWHEVKKGLRPEQFTIKNLASRLKKEGDLFRPVLGKGVNMKRILARIEKDS